MSSANRQERGDRVDQAVFVLDCATAFFAFAAILWFLSTYGDLPAMASYWGAAPLSDPFFQALVQSAKLNAGAALSSGLSSLGLRIVVDRFTPARP